jgi:hypothetical protein
MRFKHISFSKPHIASDHDHVIQFREIVSNEPKPTFQLQDVLKQNDNYYIVFDGDPVIEYGVSSLTTKESKRLKDLTTEQHVTSVESASNSIKLYTNFSDIEVNTLLDYDSQWVSTDNPYVITTNTQVCPVGHYIVENETSTIIATKYCILDNGSCEYSTDNKLMIAAEGTLTVNGELHERGVFSDLTGSVTISSETKSYVFLIEYTN